MHILKEFDGRDEEVIRRMEKLIKRRIKVETSVTTPQFGGLAI